jgi:hypothetical protein
VSYHTRSVYIRMPSPLVVVLPVESERWSCRGCRLLETLLLDVGYSTRAVFMYLAFEDLEPSLNDRIGASRIIRVAGEKPVLDIGYSVK